MQVISTKIHGAIDYVLAFVLLGIPFTLHYGSDTIAGQIFVIAGFTVLAVNLITRYEHGIINALSMPVHLAVDIIIGTALASSPWLFGFSHVAFTAHLAVGLLLVALALTTKTTTSLIS